MLPGNIAQKVAMCIDSIKSDDDSYTFIASSRAYSMLVPACDTQIRGQLDGVTKSFGQHSA